MAITTSTKVRNIIPEEILNNAESLMLMYWRDKRGSYSHPFELQPDQMVQAALTFAQHGILLNKRLPTLKQLKYYLTHSSTPTGPLTWARYAPLWLQIATMIFYQRTALQKTVRLDPCGDPYPEFVLANDIVASTMSILPFELRDTQHANYINPDMMTKLVRGLMRISALMTYVNPLLLIQNFAKHPTNGIQTLSFDLQIATLTDKILHLACLPGFHELHTSICCLLQQQPALHAQCLPLWTQYCFAWYKSHEAVVTEVRKKLGVNAMLQRIVYEVGHPVTSGRENEAVYALATKVLPRSPNWCLRLF
jgi:hypothetical protein